MGPEERHQLTRRFQLPSGRHIEVMVFPDAGERRRAPAEPPPIASPRADLHCCPACHCVLVHPVDWDEIGSDRWRLDLRCPNCHWTGSGTYERKPVECLDEELERGMEAIVRDLRRLTRANMEDEAERFTAALRTDLIVPFDF
ncbi:MAG TPA: hypothetical protein VK279_14690 [Solirubrobacteraceae bacterium]|nr:hypothetical protein [Solirubrobacteraceae bacterium]